MLQERDLPFLTFPPNFLIALLIGFLFFSPWHWFVATWVSSSIARGVPSESFSMLQRLQLAFLQVLYERNRRISRM
jgi:hypothetical protein